MLIYWRVNLINHIKSLLSIIWISMMNFWNFGSVHPPTPRLFVKELEEAELLFGVKLNYHHNIFAPCCDQGWPGKKKHGYK